MPFPPKLIFLVAAFLCFFFAMIMDWPRNPPNPGYGHSLGWAGGAFLVLGLASS